MCEPDPGWPSCFSRTGHTHTYYHVKTEGFSDIQGLTGQYFYLLSQRTMGKRAIDLPLLRENTFI